MSLVADKISSSEYIYSAKTKWGLKKYVCDIAYFTEEPLSDLYYVICSILDSTEGKCYDKLSLGILLGFSMTNQGMDGTHDVYYDVAEVRIFEDILAKIESEHLIKIEGNNIALTQLGCISLKEGKHYQFFTGTQEIFEHSMIKSEMPLAMLMFPFFKDMGICSYIKTKKQIWPNDELIGEYVYYKNDPLKKRIELQSSEKNNIYWAELQDYYDIETLEVPVKLFKFGEEYLPVVMNGNNLAYRATELLNERLNSLKRENVILECLFKKLWDDKTSILDFNALEPYFELVDFEELTKDSRTVWSDQKLLEVIVGRATATCWRNISRHCNINVLRDCIKDHVEDLDWPILTERIDDTFLIEKFLDYPWDLEVLSEDINRKESTIEQLILLQKETEEDWNWDELGKRLSQEFVLSHLDIINVDLASFTTDSEDVRKAIIKNCDKKWDWIKIENEFSLDFILRNIAVLGAHFDLAILFDRVFTDAKWAQTFLCNTEFAEVVLNASKDDGALSSAIFNEKEYLWSNEIIDLLSKHNLLCWQSTPYMKGFECNPYIVWTKSFFDRYSINVSTEEGLKFISSRITDIKILTENTDYPWDWEAISSNKALLSEMKLFSLFGSKLNWRLVFENQNDASFLQSIEDIKSMIGEDHDAWTSFSFIANIDYVISKYKDLQFPWDWKVLTERMFPKLKLENLGNEIFVNQWDWTYLSEHVSIDFLSENLEKFSKYWDWEVSLPRIFKSENRFDFNFLDKLAVILTNIPGKEACQTAWTALTKQYSFKELKRIINETVRKRAYWWDMNYFFQHKEFYVFRDLEECRHIVDWNILSSATSIDESFKYNPKLGIKEKAWRDEVRKILSDDRNRWNYALLSHFESLRDEQWFISMFKEKVDWEYLSKASKIFCVRDKQKLNEIIEAFKKYISFRTLSERNDVDIEQIIKINPRADYDYNNLIKNGAIKATIRMVEEMPDYPWDWQLVTSSISTFYPTAEFLLSHLECDINWELLSLQDNPKAWSDIKLIIEVATNDSICRQIDWFAVSTVKGFPLTSEVLNAVPKDKINWKHLSGRKSIVYFIDDYINYVDWKVLSNNQHVNSLEIEFLAKYKEYLDWSIICKKKDFIFTNEILDLFADYIDWNLASNSTSIRFTRELVDKYKDKWYWPILVKNKAFHNTVDISDMPYARQLNIVDFISQFPRKPKAYHFTHMDNAIKIIRSMKLQSRNYANGNFSNSAGSNVHRTGKAHRFARFYFAPKSPTQFYNECLGKDKYDKYYDRAFNLGLPKCPLPVFFIFDIEELLSVMPELCYYSNGNMQKDSSRCFKVIEAPNKIKAREIYINSYETFDERQQEFLIDGELDFSKLKSVQICCYDEYQAEMLKKELKGTRWEDVVSIDAGLYEHSNRELHYRENDETIRIDTDYRSPFEFRVAYNGSQVPVIINKENVIRQRGNNIYVSSALEIKKESPFEIYFEVSNPRFGSWLIYRSPAQIVYSKNFNKISADIPQLLKTFEDKTTMLGVKISKTLFSEHMVNSYHGIAHTTRVMWNAFLIASFDKSVDDAMVSPILFASLIHDIGKHDDREGEIHGEKSANLYKEYTYQLYDDSVAESILEAVKYHSVSDSKCPFSVHSNKIWEILKDADALDRSRLPGRGCNPSFLRNDIFSLDLGQEILSISKELPLLTKECNWDYPIIDLINAVKTLI